VANGAKIQLYDCNGTGAQKWTFSAGELINSGSGKCLDVTGKSTADGARLQIWTCGGTSNQMWSMSSGGTTTPPTSAPAGTDLTDPAKKEVAMELVSAAENSSLDWKAQYKYIEDIGDGRGYTAGIIGFCSGTGDMLELVQAYTKTEPGNVLAKYLPALQKVNNTDSHAGLDPNFTKDWKTAAADPVFQAAQDKERDDTYFTPAVNQAKADGLRALGQFIYYDAAVMHGFDGEQQIRARAIKDAKPPSQGGSETAYLQAYLNERVVEMKKEEAHSDTSRVDTEQRVFLNNGNLDLNTPLDFKTYGDPYHIG
jgi:chitosanase